jgi:GxxExxY protein
MTNTSNITNMNSFNDQSVLAKLTGLDYFGLDQLDLDHVKKDISLSFIEYVVNQVFLEIGSFHNENVYREAMLYEFRSKGYTVSSEVSVPIKYKDTLLSYVHGRIDILLENDIVIELKAISTKDLVLATQQCKSYMKCLNKSKGYVINFSKTEKGRPVIQEINLDETNTSCAQNDIREISKGIQQNNKTIELILQKMENLENCIRTIHEKQENVRSNHLTTDIEIIKMQLNNLHTNAMSKKDNIVLLIDEKEKDETDAETDAETEDEDKEAEAESEEAESDSDQAETEEVEAEAPDEPQAKAEAKTEEEAEDEAEVEPEEEADAEADAQEEEADAEEEEEELFEIEIDDITYCTNNEETGVIYEVLKDGNVGKAVGYLKDGEPIFT